MICLWVPSVLTVDFVASGLGMNNGWTALQSWSPNITADGLFLGKASDLFTEGHSCTNLPVLQMNLSRYRYACLVSPWTFLVR